MFVYYFQIILYLSRRLDAKLNTNIMNITIFQIVINGEATKFTFNKHQKIELVDKIIELQKIQPFSNITFLTIEL